MEEERIISGFCKMQNSTQTIFCEYCDGQLVSMDCATLVCDFKETCENYKKAHEGCSDD